MDWDLPGIVISSTGIVLGHVGLRDNNILFFVWGLIFLALGIGLWVFGKEPFEHSDNGDEK